MEPTVTLDDETIVTEDEVNLDRIQTLAET